MTLFDFPAARRTPIIVFVIAVLAVGFLRFGLSLSGAPDSTTTYFSITAVIIAATVYFAFTASGWKEMFVASYAVILAYTFVAVIALGYTVVTRQHTIFQPYEHAFGLTAGWHLASMVGSGVSFEPLTVFGLMWLIGWIRALFRPRLHAQAGN
jgi:hypothetical protein